MYPVSARTTPERIPIEINRGLTQAPQRLPLEIYTTADGMEAAAGVVGFESHPKTTQASPTNGTWYLRAKVVINNTTGIISSTDVEWSTSTGTNTATTFYQLIGEITVTAGDADPESIVQYSYGPMVVVIAGAVDSKWQAIIY